ncbi:MAG: 3D domain-containing protein [Patescibacteria group bacterium]|nr:3D domain-containing protein [Patescibacteria group bacterium]
MFIPNNNYKDSDYLLKDIQNNYLFIINKQRKSIQILEKKLQRKQTVNLSFYHPESKGINSDIDPNNTATMTKPTVGRTIAISKELFDLGWLGNKIYIDGFGVFIAEDRMSSGIKGKCIDICVDSKEKAFQLGKKYNVLAVML